MSSHVVVIDSTARRAVVKTNPSKPLADVLQEACAKLGLNASQYGLKHQSKQVDLSLLYRLSGLTSGAKLELVQLSKSPSVVTVALQLPDSEAHGTNGRVLDKFPSTTTLWLVLRKFEAGVAGNGPARNLTAKCAPAVDGGSSGAGRLYYQMPVLQSMGRELATFSDLQKSLAQLGFNSGNVLFRLSFRTTQEPLEEAMMKITQYFKEFEEETTIPSAAPAASPAAIDQAPPAIKEENVISEEPSSVPVTLSTSTAEVQPLGEQIPEQPTILSDLNRPVTVYRPPTNTTPQSALASYREEDYVPSIEHAKSHQDRLNQLSHNVRLPSDREIAEKAAAEQEKLAAIKEVEVKIRFPEQSQVVAKFGQPDTGSVLYSFVRDCLDTPFANEKFSLAIFGAGVSRGPFDQKKIIPDSDRQYLIKDLGLKGRVLVNFTWGDHASTAARKSGTNLLKSQLRSQAQDIQIPAVPGLVADDEDNAKKSPLGKLGAALKGDGSTSQSGGRKGGVPKWLKLPGKK
ncbi:GLUT4 regulating protein TUG-domain-containing protein [Talaromyces proteolyticus]|uniref:GLUT4 regulating protein TUG-domain-containing protein n=1 Tax=Talaromyces proteolyticus TaxID=1131652 RepID=A0AAD4KP55_9EURO|nr:GLUT4 regulating protein TUG-domain-containing protein [Talaromyces proteolyticus]KAH8693618.1 GLUT4 regulating protein TUG-domain-containing protein [Talaromyces proteolyticus]